MAKDQRDRELLDLFRGETESVCAHLDATAVDHHRHHGLAKISMRDTDDSALQDARLRVQDDLDLFRVDVVAARDDQVLVPPDDLDITLIVDQPEIAGNEETILAELGCRLLRWRWRPERRRPLVEQRRWRSGRRARP